MSGRSGAAAAPARDSGHAGELDIVIHDDRIVHWRADGEETAQNADRGRYFLSRHTSRIKERCQMITSQTAFLSEINSEFDVITPDKRAYLNDRLRHRLYDLVISEFMAHQGRNPEFTQAVLARRIGSHPDLVNRWLSSPGNWTLDTVSNLLAGISGAELGISVDRLSDLPPV